MCHAQWKGILFIDSAAGTILSTAPATRYAASFFTARDGTIGVVDTATWTISAVDTAARSVGSPTPAPFESRAMAVDPQTRDLWAADWKNGRIVRIPGDGGAAKEFADVEHVFGISAFSVSAGR